MKKFVLIFITLMFINSCSSIKNDNSNMSLIEQKLIENNIELKSKIKLGYCPTMQKYVDEIVKKENYELTKFSSTQDVLNSFKNEIIDIALIGRIAKNNEINQNIKSEKLLDEERFTYTSNTKIGILESQIPEYKNVIKSISWNDWQDNYELAVILDELGNKVEKYRLPILYFK